MFVKNNVIVSWLTYAVLQMRDGSGRVSLKVRQKYLPSWLMAARFLHIVIPCGSGVRIVKYVRVSTAVVGPSLSFTTLVTDRVQQQYHVEFVEQMSTMLQAKDTHVVHIILFDEHHGVICELDVRHESWRTAITGHAIKRCCREVTQQERISSNRRMRERVQHFADVARKMAAVRWRLPEVRVLTPG